MLFENKETQTTVIEALQRIQAELAAARQQIQNLEGQNIFLGQQIIQVGMLAGQQTNASQESAIALREELKRFQTGGVQHAMSAVFYKLFRELLQHMNQLDMLVATAKQGAHDSNEDAWIESIQALQGGYEALLKSWGCTPMNIHVFVDQFDPEYHEAVMGSVENLGKDVPPNTILQVQQRGWKLHNVIIQFPQVIVR